MTTVPVDDIIFDPHIYPRLSPSTVTIEQYADAMTAGDIFPPVKIEPETNRIIDGYHRWQAHKRLGLTEIEAVYQPIPQDIPPKLFSASMSVKHGDRIKTDDLKRIARDIVTNDASFNISTVARYCGVTRQTASGWVKDIVDYRLNVRRVQAYIMAQAGWTQQRIADHLGVTRQQIASDVKSDITCNLAEALLRDAVAGLPDDIDGETITEDLRQQAIFATWDNEQRDLVKQLRAGETIIVTMRDNRHTQLIEWASDANLYERVDRATPWGNPFETPDDGDRPTVITNYETHYLPYKPSLLKRIPRLHGKALGCWCYPKPCHADILKRMADQ
jgi:ParB-like chromosome segregation protein Spo0J